MKPSFQPFFCVLFVGWTVVQSFGQVKKESNLKNTDVLPTLEHSFNKERNAVYCATLLYTIDKLKTTLNCSIKADEKLKDLKLVLESTSHQNTLREDEFHSEVKISKGRISAKASFEKSLPFEMALFSGQGLKFNGQKVASFEWLGGHGGSVEILYFRNNSNFTLKLRTSDAEHEIILSMSDTIPESFSGLVCNLNKSIELGRQEKVHEDMKWKYSMTRYDLALIPELALDIEADFPSIKGNFVWCSQKRFQIERVTQQTAFYLNEKGAKVQSEAVSDIVFAALAEDEEVTSKLMIFDKPFFVMLRRKNATYPYFCMWVANTDHMRSGY